MSTYCTLVAWLIFAPTSNSVFTTSKCPLQLAVYNGLQRSNSMLVSKSRISILILLFPLKTFAFIREHQVYIMPGTRPLNLFGGYGLWLYAGEG